MTHKDIYTKFMIEYDKANVTSSYPSLTPYEVATILDKAYLALIAQKITGNNPRRVPFEGDIKSIADVEPLLTHADITFFDNKHAPAVNITLAKLPKNCLYFIQALLEYEIQRNPDRLEEREVYTERNSDFENEDDDYWVRHVDVYYDENNSDNDETSTHIPTITSGIPYDNKIIRLLPAKLVSHQTAEKFFCTPYNMPWVKNPVCYIEGGVAYFVYDSINKPVVEEGATAHLTYIKSPKKFVDSIVEDEPVSSGELFILDVSTLDGVDKIG